MTTDSTSYRNKDYMPFRRKIPITFGTYNLLGAFLKEQALTYAHRGNSFLFFHHRLYISYFDSSKVDNISKNLF
jgi:hypothetical protein